MKNKIFISSFCLLLACASQQQVFFRIGKSSIIYKMNIPRDYSFKGLSGSSEKEQQYWYADSSVLYMTEFINSPNYDVLKNLVSDWALSEAYRNRDTMNFSGRNSLGLYWRERKLRHVAVGYKNVRPEKVVMFDKIIDDIQESNE